MEIFVPDMYQKSIYTIDYNKLKERGIKCVLFDLDNTLVPGHVKDSNPKIKKLFDELKLSGFKVIIFSNSPKKRVKIFKDKLEVDACANAQKPLKKKFDYVLTKYDFDESDVAIVGDQIMTDIWGGNKVGITTILINPVSHKDFAPTKIFRFFEKIVIKSLKKKDLFQRGRYYD